MFKPSSEKVAAAEAYLAALYAKPRSFAGWQHVKPGPRWRSLPPGMHAYAERKLAEYEASYLRRHGYAPSRQARAALIGCVARHILCGRHCFLSKLWKFWNARAVVRGSKNIRNPSSREGFTPRDTRHRSSVGNVSGI